MFAIFFLLILLALPMIVTYHNDQVSARWSIGLTYLNSYPMA